MKQCIKVSQQQWHSSYFFSHLFALEQLVVHSVEPQKLSLFYQQLLAGGQLSTFDSGCEPSHELVIYANEYSFDSLCQILSRLNHVMDLGKIDAINAPDDAEDFAIKVAVKAEPNDKIKALLQELAEQYRWELVLLELDRPSLNQAGLLLMDMDSTAIQIECIDEIAKLAGVGEQVAAVTAQAMRGELDFEQSLRKRVLALKGAEESVLNEVADNLPLMNGLERLVKVLKQHNWKLAIASGGFTYFADKLKDDLGLDAAISNQLELTDGKLTGQVLGEVIDASVKKRVLGELAQQYDIPASQTVAMGDGANDLMMLGEAALGVACHAKPLVKEKTDAAVSHYGLDVLLFLLSR